MKLNYPRECATCEHYDNWEGYCKKHKENIHFYEECDDYKLCKEFRGKKK